MDQRMDLDIYQAGVTQHTCNPPAMYRSIPFDSESRLRACFSRSHTGRGGSQTCEFQSAPWSATTPPLLTKATISLTTFSGSGSSREPGGPSPDRIGFWADLSAPGLSDPILRHK